MIDLFTGTPGSGKTSHAAKVITEYSQYGRLVVGNIELASRPLLARSGWSYKYVPTLELDPLRLLRSGPCRENSRLLVIDEAQLIFNSRDWNAEGRRNWIEFFTQHRKLGWRVLLITQDKKMLDKQIIALAENNYIHRKMSSFGFVSRIISLFFANRAIAYVVNWAPGRLKTGQGLFILWPWYSRLFDTSKLLKAY